MASNGLGAPVVIVGGETGISPGSEIVANPPEVLVTGGGLDGVAPRLRVDTGSTGFFAKREFTTFFEFSDPLNTDIPNGQRVLIRFVTPVNLIVNELRIVADNGQIRAPVFAGGTPTGTFSTALSIVPANSMTEGPPAYAAQATVSMAGPGASGAVNITGGVPVTTVRLKIENATGAATTSTVDVGDLRGLPPGTYYVLIDNIGAGLFEGVVYARWEERP